MTVVTMGLGALLYGVSMEYNQLKREQITQAVLVLGYLLCALFSLGIFLAFRALRLFILLSYGTNQRMYTTNRQTYTENEEGARDAV